MHANGPAVPSFERKPWVGPALGQRRVERISQGAIETRSGDPHALFVAIRAILIEWLAEKARQPLPETIISGETGELDTIGAQRVETAAIDQLWAMRQDDQDANIPRRTWVTEAALAVSGANSVLLGFRLHCATSGESAPFSRSIPRFMRQVAQKNQIYLDSVEIDPRASTVESEWDVDDLVNLMRDPNRRHPVIGISLDMDDTNPDHAIIDPDHLARDVFGTAHVRLITRKAAFLLSDRVGREFSVFQRAVRVWRAPLNTEVDIPFGHPLAVAWRIAEWRGEGPSAYHRYLVDQILRASAGRRDANSLLPPFAEIRRIAAQDARRATYAIARTDAELLELSEAENRRLTAQLGEQHAEYDELISFQDEELSRISCDRDDALAEVAALRARVAVQEEALRRQRGKPPIEIPENLATLESWAAQHLEDSVKLLPRAFTAAKKSDFEDVAFVYQVLLMIRDYYVPMRREGASETRENFAEATRELGLQISPSISDSSAGTQGDEYFVTWQGKRRKLDQHFKRGTSRDPRYCFRLYFFWDEEAERVVIGWLPSHLPTRIT